MWQTSVERETRQHVKWQRNTPSNMSLKLYLLASCVSLKNNRWHLGTVHLWFKCFRQSLVILHGLYMKLSGLSFQMIQDTHMYTFNKYHISFLKILCYTHMPSSSAKRVPMQYANRYFILENFWAIVKGLVHLCLAECKVTKQHAKNHGSYMSHIG